MISSFQPRSGSGPVPACPSVRSPRTGGRRALQGPETTGRAEPVCGQAGHPALRRPRACSVKDGGFRPPRGAERGLEATGRWFRPQQNRRANRHGSGPTRW
ncbi:hypothetical protein EXN32_11915 [Agrobacterium tumefaciens]|uniref:Uncharacterized protein n=1 Tax=Agrobacterium tumefaciens TaxID=358 RepID=A0A546YUI8_AGRTU|nr:hypothetical protein EXN61_23530 [Agrobacterium tumefaciens]TRB16670.1 hypothetical protein EXN32_11915 [Agrobacterium tumefaciens]